MTTITDILSIQVKVNFALEQDIKPTGGVEV
jgi:hypothetical protein